MRITINISTCPNDTFMFDALIHKKINTRGYEFDLTMADIEQLNKSARDNSVMVTKLSYATYPSISKNYQILNSGSAIGRGNGPLLVSRKKIYTDELDDVKIGIPGKMTTANFLLNKAFPNAQNKSEYLFSDISTAIMDGEIDCGVLIHEERFTYSQKGLSLVADLGQEWENITGKMIPLGAIVIQRELSEKTKKDIESLIRESVQFAFNNPSSSYSFVKANARELDDETISKHIEMFVNKYSLNLTEEGIESVNELFNSGDFKELNNIFV